MFQYTIFILLFKNFSFLYDSNLPVGAPLVAEGDEDGVVEYPDPAPHLVLAVVVPGHPVHSTIALEYLISRLTTTDSIFGLSP